MMDHQDQIREEFDRKVERIRREADHLGRQAREIKTRLGELAEASARSREEREDAVPRHGGSAEAPFGPAGFPILLDDLNVILSDWGVWSERMAARETELRNHLAELEGLSAEITGLHRTLEESLEGNTAAWVRFAGHLRDVISAGETLRRDQEELSAVLEETIRLGRQKEQGRSLLLDLVRSSILQGEQKRDRVEEILGTQKTISGLVEQSHRLLEQTLTVYGESPGGLNRFPEILGSFSEAVQAMLKTVEEFHQNLAAFAELNLAGSWRELTEQARIENGADSGRSGRGAAVEKKAEAPDRFGISEKRLDSISSLNEQINLMALNAFIAAVQGEKGMEALAEVFGEIRMLSEQIKKEMLAIQAEGREAEDACAVPVEKEETAVPDESPAAAGRLTERLQSLHPVLDRLNGWCREQGRLTGGFLEHLQVMNGESQEMALLIQEQTLFAGRLLRRLLPLKTALQQLQQAGADQSFQVQEVRRLLEKTQSQGAAARTWLAESGRQGPDLVHRLESVREMGLALAGDLFRLKQEEERLQKEGGRLRSLLDTAGESVSAQFFKQLDFQETVEKVRRSQRKIDREMETQRLRVQGVLSRVRQLVDHLEPFARDSREQSQVNRTFLEALSEIRGVLNRKWS